MMKQETGSFSLMKNMNTTLILNIIRENKEISRANVAKMSGLTPATVTNITGELISMGLICEAQRGESKGGRKPVMLRIIEDAYYVIGVYMGSKVIEIVLSDIEANIIKDVQIKNLSGMTQETALSEIIRIIKELIDQSSKPVIGIGVGIHGLVKKDEGIAIFSPNLGWENVRVKDILMSEFELPVIVDNDVRAMTLGERLAGSAKHISDFILVYVGSGIGGSIVLNDKLYDGATGVAGEFGHTTLIPDGPKCSCGNHGCFQALASEGAMLDHYKKLSHRENENIDFLTLLALYNDDDPAAKESIHEGARYIGLGIANLINIFNPSLVILSGNIAKLGSKVLNIINNEVKKRCMEYMQSSTRIVLSKSKSEGFMRGVACLVIGELYKNPSKLLNHGE